MIFLTKKWVGNYENMCMEDATKLASIICENPCQIALFQPYLEEEYRFLLLQSLSNLGEPLKLKEICEYKHIHKKKKEIWEYKLIYKNKKMRDF